MHYFKSTPKIVTKDSSGNSIYLTNLLTRVSVIPDYLKNPLLYYSYDVQESDTPEIIADKYYGDSYRYWIVLFSNEVLDPQWDWPMIGRVFENYVIDKYVDPYLSHHYEKIITQYDDYTKITTTNTLTIDESAYTNLVESSNVYTFPSGTVNITITKRAVTYYQYEYELNESKRSIKLLKKEYAPQIEKEFKTLMNA
jgi:hypothetical protein